MTPEEEYFHNVHNGLQQQGCGMPLIILFIVITLGTVIGCRTVKSSEKENTETADSVRIEYREKIVKVPVVVEVEVPVEQKDRMTNDSTSHLETSFAVSDASMIWIGGVPFLRHSLENKPQKIAKADSVPVKEKETVRWKTRRVTYTKTVTLERQLSRWQQAKQDYGGWVMGILAGLIIIFVIRKRNKVIYKI